MKAHVKKVVATPEDHARFREEAARLALRWRCADCAHFAPSTGRCSLEYPNALLRDADTYVDGDGNYVFCKYFEAA